MTRIESPAAEVQKSAAEIFNFLSDFNNMQKLMPEQVVDWKSSTEECSFTIKGMLSLGMKYAGKVPNSLIEIIPNGKVPFNFKLICTIEDKGASSVTRLTMEADLNPFLKMMAEKPLNNFVNMLAERFKGIWT